MSRIFHIVGRIVVGGRRVFAGHIQLIHFFTFDRVSGESTLSIHGFVVGTFTRLFVNARRIAFVFTVGRIESKTYDAIVGYRR